MRIRFLIAAIAVLGLTAFAPAPFPRSDKKDDPKKMLGAWTLVRYDQGGAPVSPGGNTILKVKIEGNKLTFIRVIGGVIDTSLSYTFTLDPAKEPRWLDLTRVARPRKVVGIYRFDGDQLQIALHSFGVVERPTEFGGADKHVYYMTMKRDKP